MNQKERNKLPHLLRITTVPISLKLLLSDQAKFMQSKGMVVSLCSSHGPEIPKLVEEQECPHYTLPMERSIAPVRDAVSLFKMISLQWRLRPDIVHSHTPKAGLISMLAARLVGIEYRIHTVAGMRSDTMRGISKKLMLLMEKITYLCSSEVWPNSPSLLEKISDLKLCPRDKMRIIGEGSSNGIDLLEFNGNNLEDKILAQIKLEINYTTNFRYLVFVGRVVRDKGIEELVCAFKKCQRSTPNLKLLVVGWFEADLDPVSKLTQVELEENPDITLVGYSPYVKYYLHIAELLVFPSHREGFPNVPLQAGAMKCPIVCSRIGGNVDIVTEGKTGYLHECGNADDLHSAIQRALKNPVEAETRAERLHQEIHQKFSRTYVQEMILANYQRLLHS
ncbi:MAG: glycosyltransferase family 4 protein [Saprospiraceae bacterium]|nr:glycosyltransferase family 4 protein [Saprospiraceae bacterium]